LEPCTQSQVIVESDTRGKIGRGVKGARATAAIKGIEGVFPDPVCARGRSGEAGGNAVAGCLNLGELDIDFGYDAGHVDTLVVANATTAEVWWDYERWEFLGCDFIIADCTLESRVGIFEDVELVV